MVWIFLYIVLIFNMNRKEWSDEPRAGYRKKEIIIYLGETEKRDTASWNRETRASLSVRARKKSITK